ncbi:hypothetical protein [Desulfohalovibrio reitneri]|uniref:hypothetical protein n=1 Tax=Desulfohalovibrio reitneri TaxID=1307759 RepID=UPI0004A7312C|nr:hypothetical protein [Desulfohalovibrio reitneri]
MEQELLSRLKGAQEIDLTDVVLDQNAVDSWMKMLQRHGCEPSDCVDKAKAKYDPNTKELYLTVPSPDQEEQKNHLVFVLQEELWDVDLSDKVFH